MYSAHMAVGPDGEILLGGPDPRCPVCRIEHPRDKPATIACAWIQFSTTVDDVLIALLDTLPERVRGQILVATARAAIYARHHRVRRFMRGW